MPCTCNFVLFATTAATATNPTPISSGFIIICVCQAVYCIQHHPSLASLTLPGLLTKSSQSLPHRSARPSSSTLQSPPCHPGAGSSAGPALPCRRRQRLLDASAPPESEINTSRSGLSSTAVGDRENHSHPQIILVVSLPYLSPAVAPWAISWPRRSHGVLACAAFLTLFVRNPSLITVLQPLRERPLPHLNALSLI